MLAKLLILACSALLMASIGSCQASSASQLRKYVVTLSTVEGDQTICTGVAVGKHVVSTAKHCLEGGIPRFNHLECPNDYVFADDGTDNVLIWTCQTFSHYTSFAKGSPKIGERVQQWGHVLGLPLLYREGYLSRIQQTADEGFYPLSTIYIWDIQDAGGDSGSAIFNSKGEVVCNTSHGVMDKWAWPHFALMACFPPKFTDEQLSYLR